MKHLVLLLFPLLAACNTLETFDDKGRVTSRRREPSPEFWTALGNGVAQFGASSISAWAKQQENEQKWERGEK